MLRRICGVSVDKKGRAKIEKPVSEGTYYLCEEIKPIHVEKLKSREFFIKWIDECVFGDLKTLQIGILAFEKMKNKGKLGGGNFLLASGCFMALEYLAYIYGGKGDATTNVRSYSNRFLVPIDKRYGDIAELLWRSFRNGLIHGSWPQLIRLEEETDKLLFVGVGNSIKDDHFKAIDNFEKPSFGISGARLFRDLYKSFNQGFKKWLLEEAPEIALKRGSPQILELRIGDALGRKQFKIMHNANKKIDA